jgi:predicted sulfurtransferase
MSNKGMRRAAAALALGMALAGTAVGGGTTQDPDALAKIPRITIPELEKLMTAGDVLLVDVRNTDGYEAGHLPGAISVPLDTVAARAGELAATKKKTVVTYCS